MNIVHINLFDAYGGAARIANQLMDDSRRKGHRVHQFVFNRTKSDDPYTLAIGKMPASLLKEYESLTKKTGLVDYFMPYLLGVIYHPIFKEADVVHLHCINGGYFSALFLPLLAEKKLIWTLHDTLGFTAHCLYPHLCKRWQNDYCLDCPMDKEQSGENRVLLQQVKEKIINVTPVTLVAPSNWIKDMVGQSIFKQKETRLIYNGIDTKLYSPQDKAQAREAFGLPKDKFILMFAAHGGLSSEMKGGKHMIEVLKILQKEYPQIAFLHVGSLDGKVPEGIELVTYTQPYIEDEAKMAQLYSAADLFVSTSLTESFGLTVCESMACGTPVAAFAAGGIKEIIEDGKNGWLVALKDEKALAKRIGVIVKNRKKLYKYSQEATKRVQENFSIERCCEAYEKIYRSI